MTILSRQLLFINKKHCSGLVAVGLEGSLAAAPGRLADDGLEGSLAAGGVAAGGGE